MWIMTNRGFYSIVEKPWDKPDKTLTVRARQRSDIEAFMKLIDDRDLDAIPNAREKHAAEGSDFIEFDGKADYAWRIRAPRTTVGLVLARLIGAIDYDNFKNSVYKAGLTEHASCYSGVWSVMARLQDGGGRYHRGAEEKGGGAQKHFPFHVASNSYGDGIAAEPEPDDTGYIFDEDNPEDWECPHCGESVDPNHWGETATCNHCDSELHVCLRCEEWLGPGHSCEFADEVQI